MIDMIRQIEKISEDLKNATWEQDSGSRQILDSLAALNAITRDVESGAVAMNSSAANAVEACRSLTELSRSVDGKVTSCENGAKTLRVNSELVVRAAENARTGARELEDSVSYFRVRD
jgi:methyl-accepting chemotaxis protein